MANNLVVYYKRGDSASPFRARLFDGTTPIDLTLASTVKLLVTKPDGTLLSGTLTKENQTTNTGWVNRAWGLTELNTAGSYTVEVEITWADSTVQTFPADRYGLIIVQQDLG